MNTGVLNSWFPAVALAGSVLVSTPVVAKTDVLDHPVSLTSETDLIQAVFTTLQHAITTSERYRGDAPKLRRFAKDEVNDRRQQLRQLEKLAPVQPASIPSLAITAKDARTYVQAMLRNHVRLVELIEFGVGLPLSTQSRRFMTSLARDANAEMSALHKLEPF